MAQNDEILRFTQNDEILRLQLRMTGDSSLTAQNDGDSSPTAQNDIR